MFVTLPVKDLGRARKIVAAATGPGWTTAEKDGVNYFSQTAHAGLIPFQPTVAISDRMLVAGIDQALTEQAITRSKGGASALAGSVSFKTSTATLPEAHTLFAYIDLPLLYARLDASLRPIIQMAAAFAPSSSKDVDLTKLPDVATVTKHLSPIVSSHSYDRDGYMMESVGPVTFSHAIIGSVALGTFGYQAYEKFTGNLGGLLPGTQGGWSGPSIVVPTPPPTATPVPTP